MNRSFYFIIFLLSIGLLSCNGASEGNHGPGKKAKTEADSLMDRVMEGHDIGMAKMGKLTRAEQTTRRLLDSISQLPEKARRSAEPLRARLDSLQKELSYAEMAMNKWMDEFNMDSAIHEAKARIEYLKNEELKVDKVKEAILGSLQKADSVLKEKF